MKTNLYFENHRKPDFQTSVIRILIGSLTLLCLTLMAFGQGRQPTNNKPDQTLRSNGRVNPSTLALEMDVPLASYPGRGINVPVSLSYSSKAWRLRLNNMIAGNPNCRSGFWAEFGENSASGWTSSLGIAYVEYTGTDTTFNGNGFTHSVPTCGFNEGENNGYIKRVQVHLPSGESHEMRASDTPNLYAANYGGTLDMTGTYYAVDGSKLKYVETESSQILYLPDGSHYEFSSNVTLLRSAHVRKATLYKDVSGNQLTFNEPNSTYPNGYWTDTLNRTIPVPLGLSAPDSPTVQDYQLPGMGGSPMTYKLYWKQLKGASAGESGLTDFNQNLGYIGDYNPVNGPPVGSTILFHSGASGFTEVDANQPPFNPVVLTAVELPNGQKYQFSYNIYSEIDRIVYPTGGEERMTFDKVASLNGYNDSAPLTDANRGVVSRNIYENASATPSTWTYATVLENFSTVLKVVTTAPDATHSERFLTMNPNLGNDDPGSWGFNSVLAGMPYEERSYASTGQIMSKKLTTWAKTEITVAGSSKTAEWHPRVTKEESIIYDLAGNALSSTTTMEYGGDLSAIDNPVNVTKTSQYGFTASLGSLGSLEKSIETDYLNDVNYSAVNLRSLPTVTRIKDASGNIAAQSQIEYDQSGYSGGYRGKPTTSRIWTDVANNQYIETHARYDGYGNAIEAIDAKGNSTTTEYSATYSSAYPTKVTSAVPDPTGANGSSSTFENSTTYDLATGLPLTAVDTNGQVTTMEYNDPMLRPTKVIPPSAGGQTVIEYTDTSQAVAVKTKTQIDSITWAEAIDYADGLGRTIKSEKKNNAGNIFVESEYDNMGRAKRVTNPYRAGDTKQWTTTNFDEAGRLKEVVTNDNAKVTTEYSVATSGALGTVVTVTDQAGKQRRTLMNNLGQLIRVDEPDDSGNLGTVSGPNQSTSYAYDALNNLTNVNQGVQQRTFQYDSISRLKQATNPESGTISYSYDANGNLTGKTDARSISTTYSYDNLNRVKTRTYSDNTTPNVTYNYDGTGLGSVPANSKGKLTKVSSSVSETCYTSFDNVGKILSSQQVTDGQTYNFAYAYNLGGMMTQETYPSGRVVTNQIATDGSLSQVGGQYNQASKTYADTFSYTATGAVQSMKLGNNRWENAQFNSRLQPTQLGLGTSASDQSLWKVNYDYSDNGQANNNGDVKKQTITVPGIDPLIQDYTYDSLNRIKSATETQSNSTTWKQTFTYDRYGNRNFDAANTTTIPTGCLTAQCNPTIEIANNRFTFSQGYTYDLSGNLVADAQGRSFIYDAENKQKEIKDSPNTSIGQYFYDGDGKRVKKNSVQDPTVFVYDASGNLVAEYLITSATPQTPTASYLTNDTLGSPRIITDQSGNIMSRRDFMPFGEEISGLGNRTATLGYQSDSVRQKFTKYEMDNESNLDFAQSRYFSYGYGRFLSPDSFTNDTHVSNPQSWNLYSYVKNNPLNMIDPLGEKGQISWWTDHEGMIHVELSASFAVYGAKGQNVSGKDLETYKNALVQGIKDHLSKEFNIYGKSFDVTAHVTAEVYGSEEEAINAGKDNIVEIGYSDIDTHDKDEYVTGLGFGVKEESFDRMVLKVEADPNNYRGIGSPIKRAMEVAAHEFGHLLGGVHNSNESQSDSIFAPGSTVLGDAKFYGSDFTRLFAGYDDEQAPLMKGMKPIQGINPFDRLSGGGTQSRWANNRNHNSASDVYNWKVGVNK